MTKHHLELAPLFDELSDGICISENDRVVYLNPAADRILRASDRRLRERSLCELLCARLKSPACDDCAERCELRKTGSPSKTVTFEGSYAPRPEYGWRDLRTERLDKPLDLRVRCLKAESGAHVTILEDISDEAAHAREREDWRHMIVHDLRTPLTAIFAVLAELRESAAGRKADETLARIGVDNCRRMIDLLDLYLDVAKLDAGLMKAELRMVPVAAAARRAADAQAPLALAKRIPVSIEAPETLRALADPELLSRVLDNLLNNALKFTPEEGRVDVAAAARGPGSLEIEVRDTGPGIPADEMPHLFDRFHQARARREGKTKGTGLGLAFCRQALQTMGGDIRAWSAPGEGSRFTVRLPRPRPENQEDV